MAEVRKSKFKSMLLRRALTRKEKEIRRFIYKRNSLIDKIVFNKLRSKFGGNLKLLASGSAPLSGLILNFFRCSLACMVVEGKNYFNDLKFFSKTNCYQFLKAMD